MELNPFQKLNFREKDKKIKQKISNQNILILTKALFNDFNASVSGQSIQQKKQSVTTGVTSTSSRSQTKQGRILLRDYLYLMNKNSEESIRDAKSRDKAQIRRKKYKLDEQKVFYLMQDEMKSQLSEVIERLQKIKQSMKSESFKDEEKTNCQNISMIYNMRDIIKDKFKKGIQEINMILFLEEQRMEQMVRPVQEVQIERIKSDNCFEGKVHRKKQPKISLQIGSSTGDKMIDLRRENQIAINGSKFMADFV